MSFVFQNVIFSSPRKVSDYDGISKNVTAVGFCESGKWMYTGGEDGTARIWDLRFVIAIVVNITGRILASDLFHARILHSLDIVASILYRSQC